jgi:hypothetical protein
MKAKSNVYSNHWEVHCQTKAQKQAAARPYTVGNQGGGNYLAKLVRNSGYLKVRSSKYFEVIRLDTADSSGEDNTALLHRCTAALLHCCTAVLLHCCTAALLYCCTAHCCTAALLHCRMRRLVPCSVHSLTQIAYSLSVHSLTHSPAAFLSSAFIP